MDKLIIPKRVSRALLNSLGSGVVPRVGLDHISVGRRDEISALLSDLEHIREGSSAFRFVIGRYGSGKSFLLQLFRNHAMNRNFVVTDADLSSDRRLAGTEGQGLATYRELMKNVATKTKPDGGALPLILERWINAIQTQIAQETGLRPEDENFDQQVEAKILVTVKNIEGLVHGFDFATVIINYWRGYRTGETNKQDAALRWLRGEFTSKVEARNALGVRVIIDDSTWYDYLKILAKFSTDIGYQGLIIILDEAVHLWKISHPTSRQHNYDKLLAIFNDTMQGKAEHLGIIVGATPKFLEDPKRGLFNDPAWQRRTNKSRFVKPGMADYASPVIQVGSLTQPEILELLCRLMQVYSSCHDQDNLLQKPQLEDFINALRNRLGAEILLTPGEIVRDFLAVLDIIQKHPEMSLQQIVHGHNSPIDTEKKRLRTDEEDMEMAEFIL